MHAELVTVLETEHKQHLSGREMFAQLKHEHEVVRAENAELHAANEGLKTAVSTAQADVEALRAEVERYAGMCQKLRVENTGLVEGLRGQRTQQMKMQREGAMDVEEEGRRATKEYMDDRLERMKHEFAKQLDVQMAAVMREVQDQKMAREQAERMVMDMRQVRGRPRALSISSPLYHHIFFFSADLET